MSTSPQRKVLITGCSDHSLGAALAVAFHNAGLHVYATARNPSKMKLVVIRESSQLKSHNVLRANNIVRGLESLGIETLVLDVLSETSIADCVAKVSDLDILVNNAGGIYQMPISDLSIPEAKKLFDLNVWSYLEVTQAFLPLLLKSKGMIVNQTSLASMITLPFQSAYNSSKAAMAMFSDSQRLELDPFGITVVELKTGNVASNLSTGSSLPKSSIYEPAKERVERAMGGSDYRKNDTPADLWAEKVVSNLLLKKPSSILYLGGGQMWVVRLMLLLPHGWLDGMIKKMTGVDVVEKIVGSSNKGVQ